jgi:malonyl-CoA O-methyltransferase
MSVQEAYNHWSTTYDTDVNRTRDLDQLVTRNILRDSRFKSILEIGCGTGKNTALLAQIGEEVYALDFSEGMLKKAKGKLGSAKVAFSAADITKHWPCTDEFADLVACSLVLEHIADLRFVFSEAFRTLEDGGRFFICELHPFRQYQGVKARFENDQGKIEIQAYVHHISDFVEAAEENGLSLTDVREWWHEEDQEKLPRLLSLIFEK